NFNILPPGPGDPATPLITGLYCIQGLAVGYDGTLYVSNPCDSEIYTVNTSGVAATFTTAVMNPGPLTFDAFGNLLAVSQNDGNIYKISPDEEVDTFVVGVYAGWLATAPDGSIWVGGGGGVNGPSEFGGPQVAAPVSGGLRHYDAMGTLVDSIVFETSQPGPFTFGPDGTLYYLGRSIVLGSAGGTDLNVPVGGDSLFKLVDGTPQALFGVPCCFSDLVIDGDGNFYLTNSEYGEVARYGPTGTLLEDPFARTPNSPRFIRFGRDADGKPNTTLYISDYEEGGPRSPEMNPPTEGSELISTLNPDAVDTPGVGNAAMDVLVDDDIAAALMGDPDALNDGEMDFLDFMGNQNGEFDIGDLRAYLIYIGVLPEN
ncbi:MAG TPA: hypothetical protein VLC48_06895, partial [Gemmatimonadota bacterium]|nr:hypothetical protein [Gemmatimonadota bacterium]